MEQRPTTVRGTPCTVPTGIHRHVEDFAQHLHGFDNKTANASQHIGETLSLVRSTVTTLDSKYHHLTLTGVGRLQRSD